MVSPRSAPLAPEKSAALPARSVTVALPRSTWSTCRSLVASPVPTLWLKANRPLARSECFLSKFAVAPSFSASVGLPLTLIVSPRSSVTVTVSPLATPPLEGDGVTEPTVGVVVSSVKLSDAVPVLPAALVSLTMIVCAPSKSPLGVKLQFPLASAVAVDPISVPSTLKCTTALASPEPCKEGSLVILSLDEAPVSDARFSFTAGATVSTVTPRSALAAPRTSSALPARSVIVTPLPSVSEVTWRVFEPVFCPLSAM